MWLIILEGSDSKDCLNFFIPDICPVTCPPTCSQDNTNSLEVPVAPFSTPQGKGKEEVQAQMASSTSALHIKGKRKDRALIVESKVRRSSRLQHANNGFKKKECKDKNGMACHSKPAAIKSKVVKNLNMSYCKMDPKDTTEDIL